MSFRALLMHCSTAPTQNAFKEREKSVETKNYGNNRLLCCCLFISNLHHIKIVFECTSFLLVFVSALSLNKITCAFFYSRAMKPSLSKKSLDILWAVIDAWSCRRHSHTIIFIIDRLLYSAYRFCIDRIVHTQRKRVKGIIRDNTDYH